MSFGRLFVTPFESTKTGSDEPSAATKTRGDCCDACPGFVVGVEEGF